LLDDRTGSYTELAAKPSIPLRVCIHGPSDVPWSGLADLRVLLVADVLTRIAELNGLQVVAVLAAASLPPGAFDQNASALGIHPPAACVSPEEAEALLGGSAHVRVARNTAGLGDRGDGDDRREPATGQAVCAPRPTGGSRGAAAGLSSR
jgi:hypothetical protein